MECERRTLTGLGGPPLGGNCAKNRKGWRASHGGVTLARVRLATDIDWREIDGEVVILDRREGRYLAVNPSGAVLWPALLDGTSEEGLVERLVGRYSIDRDRALTDVRAFLDWLTGHGLLER